MRKIPLAEAYIVSTNEVLQIREALEISAAALGASLVDEIKLVRMIGVQSESLEALLKLQQNMVDAINLAADEEVSAYELKQRLAVVLNDYVLELESRVA